MADIAMCTGVGCKNAETCYRHTAPACEFRQTMFSEVPCKVDPDNGEWSCRYYWPTESKSQIKRIRMQKGEA